MAQASGIDVIITDHHKISGSLPRAVAVVNPQRDDCTSGFDDLAGVGVAYLLVICLRKYLRDMNFWYNRTEPNLKKVCEKTSSRKVPLSISIGTITKDKPGQNFLALVKKAEDDMYEHKLLEKKSISSSIILSLKRALWEKSRETEEHAERLKNMALKLGQAIDLPQNKLDELVLLATLHDIGKITIPDDILLKKDKLTKKEWIIIKRHPEVGYNIAKSTPQLAPIAEGILSHHEWWDGTGYPQGLSGGDIPITSRIISIVDAYDAMMNGRPYKKAKNKKKSIEEIRRYAGIQFDPLLVEKFIKIIKNQ